MFWWAVNTEIGNAKILLETAAHGWRTFDLSLHYALQASFSAAQSLLDPRFWIQWGGVPGIAIIIFIETGLFFGFFFPGDSLLIVAGVLASTGVIDLRWLIPSAAIAAVLGDQVGYTIGLRLGGALETRYIRFQKNIRRAREFYQKHGGKTITIARFVPVIRTFAPPVAGAARMDYRRFVTYNILGGVGWVSATTLAGYILGKSIPNIDNYLLLVIAIVVIVSLIPAVVEYARIRRSD
jgi:membrane-associated protein